MNGIDISRWQRGINLSKVDCDFVIVKATQGVDYVSDVFKEQIDQAMSLGKLVGIYHYAGGGGFKEEADHFLKTVKDYIGKAILCLDWEGAQNPNFINHNYAIKWLKYVKATTNVTPFIYMSKSVCRQNDWSDVKEYPLWCAQYPDHKKTGYQDNPWTDKKGFGAWNSPSIFQYTGTGRLDGWDGDLDLDKSYISADEWISYAVGEASKETSHEIGEKFVKKTNSEIAKEVIDGKWGNGEERKNKLKEAGYDYKSVQSEVNRMLSVSSSEPYTVAIIANALNVRNKPTTEGSTVMDVLHKGDTKIIVEEASGKGASKWGKLTNGCWISLDFCSKV